MDTTHPNHPGRESISSLAVIRSLLIAATVVCGVGATAVGTLRLTAWAAPRPAMAAPSQVQVTPTPALESSSGREPTPLPPEPNAVSDEAPEPVGGDLADLENAPDPAPTELGEYTVRQGDTLAAIASAHGLSVADMIAANNLADPDLLFVGQTLTLPASGAASAPIMATAVHTSADTPPQPESWPIEAPAEDRWIDVDLSEQRLTAYEGSTAVRTTFVSTGLPQTPTPPGQFRVWIKLRYDDMAGPGYYIKDVPFVMYFHEGYGLHGVTWHGNFGHPMSHGCVNLPTAEAEWLFGWAEVGTLVNIHA